MITQCGNWKGQNWDECTDDSENVLSFTWPHTHRGVEGTSRSGMVSEAGIPGPYKPHLSPQKQE